MPLIHLKNSILINNQEVKDINYDPNEITAQLYTEADAKKKIAAGMSNVSISPAVEFDFGLHLYMGFAAAIAVNPMYTFEDLARVKGSDIMQFTKVGRDFLLESDTSPEKNSAQPSETTAQPSTPAPQTLDANE